MNPQTYKTRGNDNFSFVFDTGMSVAASLAMAREMMKESNRPLRSVVFLFAETGQGESWEVVGERERGQEIGRYESFRITEWFQKMCEEITSGSLECQSIWMKGLTYWIKHPKVDLDQVQIMFYPERLGSPYGFDQSVLILLGGEQISYGNLTLNNFIDEVWPTNSPVQLLKAPLATIEGAYLSYNCRSNYFTEPCANGVHCNGIKMAWFAQLALQMMSSRVDNLRGLYDKLRIQSKVVLQSNDTFDPTSPVYFTIDNLNNTYWPHFEPTITTIYNVVLKTANKRENINLSFDESRKLTIDENDFENLFINLDVLKDLSKNLPSSLGFLFTNEIPRSIGSFAESILKGVRSGSVDLSDDTNQKLLRSTGQTVAGLFLFLDYFNPNYPNHEKYKDQRVGQDIRTEPEPSLEKSYGIPNGVVAVIVLVAAGLIFVFVFCVVKRSRKKPDVISAYLVDPDAGSVITSADRVVNDPTTAIVFGIEPLALDSFALSQIRIGIDSVVTSVDQSQITAVSLMPSPCREDADESITGSMLDFEWSKTKDDARKSKGDFQTLTITRSATIQVEFKDQVSDNHGSRSITLPLTESNQHHQRLTSGEGCESNLETIEDGSTDRPTFSVVRSTLMSGSAGTDCSCVDAEQQGQPLHETSGRETVDYDVQIASTVYNENSVGNQQLEVLEDSSDSESESNETRLRFYSI